MRQIDLILQKLESLVRQQKFEELESDTIEIKPVPPDRGDWKERYKSANAFLNTRGGILILGVKEEGRGENRKYTFTGYDPKAENTIRELAKGFTDQDGRPVDLSVNFPRPEILSFMDGNIALVFVDELPSDQKYCYYAGTAYTRHLTGDVALTNAEIEKQAEIREEAFNARELTTVAGAVLADLDLDKLNEYIQLLNRTVRVETIKSDIDKALPFLTRKMFVIGDKITTLGMLVCGKHPGDYLGFRCQLHGYVDMPGEIAQDKQDLSDNVLPLMDGGLAFLLRNIQVGVSAAGGGSARPQYPETLLREVVNNSLAHRDYRINRHVIVAIKPGAHIEIRNPGSFRQNLLIEVRDDAIRLLRIRPEAKPRNPKLADVLRVYRKWEGRGIGMATLVDLCLQDEIDLPYYRLTQDEVRLFVCTGRLLDDSMRRLFASFDKYISAKLGGVKPTASQLLVMAYIIKSELANQAERHSILLTPDNNHYNEIRALENAGLIYRHAQSQGLYPVYVADRALIKDNYVDELKDLFGLAFDTLSDLSKQCLMAIYRHQNFASVGALSAKQASFFLWARDGQTEDDIKGFDTYYRRVRNAFNTLATNGYIEKSGNRYVLNAAYKQNHLV